MLSDQNKRHRYDTGQDLEDMDGPGGFHDVDPSQIFQMFFGGGGGGQEAFQFSEHIFLLMSGSHNGM